MSAQPASPTAVRPTWAAPGTQAPRPVRALTSDPWQDDPRLWRATQLRSHPAPCWPSGFAALDAELPGGGWPTHMVCELLMETPGSCEWRLLAPAFQGQATPAPRPLAPKAPTTHRPHTRKGHPPPVLLINPPHRPHLPGLMAQGLTGWRWIWVAPSDARQTLWAVEQAVRAQAAAAVVAWLPDLRPEQLRRLQIAALASPAPVFLIRPLSAAAQASAAPLRVQVRSTAPWAVHLRIIKRRGPPQTDWFALPSLPDALAPVLTPRMRQVGPGVSTPLTAHVHAHALGVPHETALVGAV
ncbi:recombinase RecA [Inhella gelatinilytica]|uniref:Recombinase RecA n=1 Tax=Inhella gelatinilytica TaxID=2795030 RepID=A0A931ND32_9BURK|nr:recombinase RecA [Inhella gelatinilytica]MBH9552662.1 recombinase RecA [Inhella gelatinilytica]